MKRFFLINPTSGTGLKKISLYEMRRFFLKKDGEFNFYISKSSKDLIEKTKEIARNKNIEQLISVGGDGTLNTILQGLFENDSLINPDLKIAVGKMGSGSDFFKTLIYPNKKCDWKSLVLDHNITPVDVGKITLHDKISNNSFSRYFINMVTVGVSADITFDKSRMPKFLPGIFKYLFPTIKNLLLQKGQITTISTQNNHSTNKLMSLFICNGKFAGGGMMFGKDAIINDGKLLVTTMKPMSIATMITRLKSLYQGNISHYPEIDQTSHVTLEFNCAYKFNVEIDGEFIGDYNFKASLLKNALNICVPMTVR